MNPNDERDLEVIEGLVGAGHLAWCDECEEESRHIAPTYEGITILNNMLVVLSHWFAEQNPALSHAMVLVHIMLTEELEGPDLGDVQVLADGLDLSEEQVASIFRMVQGDN